MGRQNTEQVKRQINIGDETVEQIRRLRESHEKFVQAMMKAPERRPRA